MTNSKRQADKIRGLNDAFRATSPPPGGGRDRVVITQGVQALGGDAIVACLNKVAAFDAFTPDNDPHLEHDFGSFEHEGEKLFWKIDYYDEHMVYGSPDPSDPAKTTRVLTVMLAEEY